MLAPTCLALVREEPDKGRINMEISFEKAMEQDAAVVYKIVCKSGLRA